MSYRYSELLLLLPALSVVITIVMIVFILLRLCHVHYSLGVQIQRNRDTIIYSPEDARYFDISRIPDRMENGKISRMTIWADANKIVPLINTTKLIISMMKVKSTNYVWCKGTKWNLSSRKMAWFWDYNLLMTLQHLNRGFLYHLFHERNMITYSL